MQYRPRHLESRLADYARFFKVVLITGARQVGKSTLLSQALPGVRTVVFDPVQDLYGARNDPDLFLSTFTGPLILDEAQFAPELLPSLKRRVDKHDGPGQYFLTGSQNLPVLRSVAESLAGRVGILHLEGMTLAEQEGRGREPSWLERLLSDPQAFAGLAIQARPQERNVVRQLWRGSMPGLLDAPESVIPGYFSSYVSTYIERDVRTLENIRDLGDFSRFLQLLGALTAQEINASQLGREVGVTPKTARHWLDLLIQGYQWLELPPYHGNAIKRLSGKPKGYLRDTGLACYLQRISSPEALAASPLLGALFETCVVGEIYRLAGCLSVPPQLYHWRTHAGAEVDLILERDGMLYPIEIKRVSTIKPRDLSGIRAFRETYPRAEIGMGLVIFAGREAHFVEEGILAVPWGTAG